MEFAIIEDGIELIEANYCSDSGFRLILVEKRLKSDIMDYI